MQSLLQWRNQLRKKQVPIALFHPAGGFVDRALNTNANIKVKSSLTKMAAMISRKMKVPVKIDKRSLEEGGIDLDMEIEGQCSNVSWRNALDLLLGDYNLTYMYDVSKLTITTSEGAREERNLVKKSFELTWLRYADRKSLARIMGSMDPEQLTDSQNNTVITVTAPRQAQFQIRSLMINLKRLEQSQPGTKLRTDPILIGGDQPRFQQAMQMLALPTTAKDKIDRKPLTHLAKYLSIRLKQPVHLNTKAMDEIGIGTDTLVHLHPAFGTLGDALYNTLQQASLTSSFQKGMLTVTTDEDAEANLQYMIYPVHDLITLNGRLPAAQVELLGGHLIRTIRATIAQPHPGWSKEGGSGVIRLITKPACVIVGQTHQNHLQLAGFFRSLRVAKTEVQKKAQRQLGFIELNSTKVTVGLPTSDTRVVSGSYQKTKLNDVTVDLSKKGRRNIGIHMRALEEVGLSSTDTITLTFNQVPLRSALQESLLNASHGLSIFNRGSVLMCTTIEYAEAEPAVKVYLVPDLIGAKKPVKGDVELQRIIRGDYESLIATIEDHISPRTSWASKGGSGSIRQSRISNSLIVGTTEVGHRQLWNLLQTLRTAKGKTSHFVGSKTENSIAAILRRKPGASPFAKKVVTVKECVSTIASLHKISSVTFNLRRGNANAVNKNVLWPSSAKTLGDALQVALNRVQLDWTIRNDQLVIHKLDEMARYLWVQPTDIPKVEAERMIKALPKKSERVISYLPIQRCFVITDTWRNIFGKP